jgi:hypothetical protein
MRKLKLDPEMLVVESFAPRDGDGAERGTVNAYITTSTQTRAGTDCHHTGQGWETCPGFSCIEKCVLSWCPLDCGL